MGDTEGRVYEMKIRKYKKTDLKEAANLISRTFREFNSSGGTREGVNDYIERYNPKEKNLSQIQKEFARTSIFYVAVEKNKILGLIRGKPSKLGNLFVDGKYHRKNIGRKLVSRFEEEVKKKKSKLIKVSASLYSVPFYEKVGYKKTTGVRDIHGLKTQPMKKRIK